jgi:hypothetical protein
VASILQTAIRAEVGAGFTSATVTYDAATTQFKITSGVAGDASLVSVLAAVSPSTGTDISGPSFLNGRSGVGISQAGYLPTGISGELDLIAMSAKAGGKFVYGWALDASYRDTPDQITAAQWVQAHTAVMPVVGNSQFKGSTWSFDMLDDQPVCGALLSFNNIQCNNGQLSEPLTFNIVIDGNIQATQPTDAPSSSTPSITPCPAN